ncbi:tetratricopeptide repeat protein [Pseudonocardia sp. 73-21]|uniref:tetratricopeptide repeat protein n=1 Tax=Pseudonocardia sp. 73-21 TaxID=1895809 RepID=UPI00095A0210|nr:tetratricopeptide repeat protein [Pseudonocardia sp. 73-21]OJY39488.1 MAG: hypothetical protein BGP03_30665 [Pseudonocardia sp. 73-21]
MVDDPEPLSTEGRALLDAARPYDAVDILRSGVAAGEPSAPDLLVRAYLDSGNWQAAAEWLAPLVEQGHVRFAGRLGVALAAIGDDERAEEALRLAIRHGEVAAANDLAILLRDGDRFGEAVQVLVRAADDGDQQAASNLVALHLENGDLPAAVTAAERYADASRPDTIVALADVRSLQGLLDEAEALYRGAGPALRAHTAYGQFLRDARADPVAAEREFREAERHNEPGWAATFGRFLVEEGRPDEARGYLQTAVGWGDRDAADLLAEIDGDNPADD